MGTFFTSDEHHGHRNVIDFCHRPFSNIEGMTEKLIDNHNSVVRPGDCVFHLGDMFWRTFSPLSALDVMRRLNGQHYYIRGNHEELMDKVPQLREQFVWVKEREKIKPVGGPEFGIVLDHFAGRVWEQSIGRKGGGGGSWQLYGHTHADLEEEDFLLSCDVGVDAWNYFPVSIEEVQQKMALKMPAFLERKARFEKIKAEREAARLGA